MNVCIFDSGVEASRGSMFTKTDISNGGVIYSSEGDVESLSDTVVIDVSDGVHHIPAHLRVVITPVDSGFPTYGKGDYSNINIYISCCVVCISSKSS